MRYEDFVLEIRSTGPETYEVEVRDAQSTRGRALVVLQLTAEAAESWLQARKKAPLPPEHAESLEQQVGVPLFTALFTERVRDLWRSSLQALEQAPSVEDGRGLHLRFLFGPPPNRALQQDDLLKADYIRFGSLPWELLCDPDTRIPLALNPTTPILRTLDGVGSPRPIWVELPFRVLVVCCAPRSLTALDVEAEKDLISQALANPDVAQVKFLDDPDLPSLRRILRVGQFHALHFIGHGGFSDESGEGYLCFKKRNARPDEDDVLRVSGTELARLVAGLNDLGLVILNACRSAQIPRRLGQSPWTAVAAAASLAGVPAVFAMQFKISDPAAIAFSGAFYESLAEGMSLEEAITDARYAISQVSVEWGTPVFFLRGKDGRLLRLEGQAPADRDAERTEPLRLGLRSFVGWNRAETHDCDRVLSLSHHFEGRDHRFVKKAELWDGTIRPRLRRFLLKVAAERRPLDVLFAAHQSIAFATGYLLETKSGARVGVLQPTVNQTMGEQARAWRSDQGEVPEGELWSDDRTLERDPGAADVAVAVGITTEVLPMVEEFLDQERLKPDGLRVGRLLVATIAPKPGQEVVRGGAHAWALAVSLAERVHRRTAAERRGVVHLFASAPNAFLVFLGQQSTSFGRTQLYEFDRPGDRHGSYERSMSLPHEVESSPSPPPEG